MESVAYGVGASADGADGAELEIDVVLYYEAAV